MYKISIYFILLWHNGYFENDVKVIVCARLYVCKEERGKGRAESERGRDRERDAVRGSRSAV